VVLQIEVRALAVTEGHGLRPRDGARRLKPAGDNERRGVRVPISGVPTVRGVPWWTDFERLRGPMGRPPATMAERAAAASAAALPAAPHADGVPLPVEGDGLRERPVDDA